MEGGHDTVLGPWRSLEARYLFAPACFFFRRGRGEHCVWGCA